MVKKRIHLPALLRPAKENSIRVVQNLLQLLQVQVTETEIEEALVKHPDYPSLISIGDALSKWRIKNTLGSIAPDRLPDMIGPFIISLNNGAYAVVSSVEEGYVEYLQPDESNNWRNIPVSEFHKIWSGIILLAQPDEHSGERDFPLRRTREIIARIRVPIVFSGLFLLTLLRSIYFLTIPGTHGLWSTLLRRVRRHTGRSCGFISGSFGCSMQCRKAIRRCGR
jgi:ABC-type bacteriocin/lantibiotic exporter with double-glycine peptidase domain